MSLSYIVDATGVDPVLSSFRPLDCRNRSNAYDVWDEYLCLLTGREPTLATCVYGALAEPPGEWFDEDGEPLADRLIAGRLFPPAFYEGSPVSELKSFLCGPLVVSPDGDEVAVGSWDGSSISEALGQLNWPMAEGLVAHIMCAAAKPPKPSQLPQPLVTAYLETDYRAQTGNQSFSLRIGKRSRDLSELLDSANCRTAAFLTAWNPKGGPASEVENRQRNRLLRADMESVSKLMLSGEGVGSDQTWQPEESFLGTGLSFEEAVHLGRHYGQNAFVWVEEDCIPKLVLLR